MKKIGPGIITDTKIHETNMEQSIVMITMMWKRKEKFSKRFNVKKIGPGIITDTKIHETGMEQSIIMITMMWKRKEKFSKQRKRIPRKGLHYKLVFLMRPV